MPEQRLLPMNDPNGFGSALANILSENRPQQIRAAPSRVVPQAHIMQTDSGSYSSERFNYGAQSRPRQLQLAGPPITAEQYAQWYGRAPIAVQHADAERRPSNSNSFWAADVQSRSAPINSYGGTYGHPEPLAPATNPPSSASFLQAQHQPQALASAETSFAAPPADPQPLPSREADPQPLPSREEISPDSGLFVGKTSPSGDGSIGFGGGLKPDMSFEDVFGKDGRKNTQEDSFNFFGR
uniref:Uncharacterized protein n=2 Tax=Steinernema glaseri TaxID=37863 RepID=A0A1I7Z376_9BILA